MDAPLLVARIAVRAARGVWRAVPAPVRKQLEDRVYYAVFHLTRVENDAYGWRPPEASTERGSGEGGGPPPADPRA